MNIRYSSVRSFLEVAGDPNTHMWGKPKEINRSKRLPYCSCKPVNGTGHAMHLKVTTLQNGLCKHCRHYPFFK